MDDGTCFLVDCGMFQGGSQIEMRNASTGHYRVSELKGIFITHAHIDHSGLVPRLVREGYRGPVYATAPTADLLKILWLDSAHIQEMEALWQSRKNTRKGRRTVEPLYTTPDAEATIKLLQPIPLDQKMGMLPGVEAMFVQAGHILGAASLHLRLTGSNGVHRVGFSGDLGRPGQLIVPDPEVMPELDTVFMESTYGNRHHKSLADSISELIEVVQQAYRDRGKVLIPAFAVERTQEIIYTLARAYERGELPKDMPVFLDSPLAIQATEIFRRYPEFLDEDTQEILDDGRTPMNLPTLKFTSSTEESQKLNEYDGPAIIIAGSGMANAGRIKHHLKHNLWRTNCHVVIVGFQAKGTTGRLLVEGAHKVKIFREDVVVKAKIHTIGGFSAHADQGELLSWLAYLAHPGLTVNLIHGEFESIQILKQVAQARFPEVRFHIPEWKEVVRLKAVPVGAEAMAREGSAVRAVDLRRRLIELESRLTVKASSLDSEQMELLDQALRQAEAAMGGA
jgi:metallo-beta-lactamase family protein